jgi:hypothetical protein
VRRVLVTVLLGGGPVQSSTDPALHVFTVDTVFKGSVQEQQRVVSAADDAGCGLEQSGTGPFLVFATRSPDLADDRYSADLCGGHGSARDGSTWIGSARAGSRGGRGPRADRGEQPHVPTAACSPSWSGSRVRPPSGRTPRSRPVAVSVTGLPEGPIRMTYTPAGTGRYQYPGEPVAPEPEG